MSSRLLNVEVLSGTVVNEVGLSCSIKLLDLALRELKKESFKTKSVKKSKSFTFAVSADGGFGPRDLPTLVVFVFP